MNSGNPYRISYSENGTNLHVLSVEALVKTCSCDTNK